MRRALAFVGIALLGCEAPDHALVHGCSARGVLEQGSHCYLSAKRLDDEQLATFDAQTKNERVRLKANVRVRRGEVTVDFPGCERGRGVARPGQPFVIECDAKINRNDYRLWLWARPKTKLVEGVQGEVSFRAI